MVASKSDIAQYYMNHTAITNPTLAVNCLFVCLFVCFCQVPKYTYSRISRQQSVASGGSGWSNEGIQKYNTLHHLVSNDRGLHGEAFNKELLKVHRARRKRSNAVKQVDRYQYQSEKSISIDDFGNDGKSKRSTIVQL